MKPLQAASEEVGLRIIRSPASPLVRGIRTTKESLVKGWKSRELAAGLIAILLGAGPALAHHSFAMFDYQKTLTLSGTVKEFQWTNPHSWIQLIVTDANGKEVEWSLEMGSLNGLTRHGWNRNSLKNGDKAVADIHPLRDGTSGGSVISVSVGGQQIGAF